jgi:hypothetical protein
MKRKTITWTNRKRSGRVSGKGAFNRRLNLEWLEPRLNISGNALSRDLTAQALPILIPPCQGHFDQGLGDRLSPGLGGGPRRGLPSHILSRLSSGNQFFFESLATLLGIRP